MAASVWRASGVNGSAGAAGLAGASSMLLTRTGDAQVLRPRPRRACRAPRLRGRPRPGRVRSAAMKQTTATTPSRARPRAVRARHVRPARVHDPALILAWSCASSSARPTRTWAARRHDHRRDVPGCRHRMAVLRLFKTARFWRRTSPGRSARLASQSPRRDLHDSCVCHPESLEVRRCEPVARVPRVVGLDDPGGLLGIMFVTILRRVMSRTRRCNSPSRSRPARSTRPARKARRRPAVVPRHGRRGPRPDRLQRGLRPLQGPDEFSLHVGRLRESFVRLGLRDDTPKVAAGGITTFSAPDVTPAYLGVGYIIGLSSAR